MQLKLRAFLILVLFSFLGRSYGQDSISYATPGERLSIGIKSAYFVDESGVLKADEVINSKQFKAAGQDVQNYPVSSSAYWVKFVVANRTGDNNLVVELEYPTVDSVEFISVDGQGHKLAQLTGEYIPISKRNYRHQNYIFDLDLKPGELGTYYIRTKASEQVSLPLTVSTARRIEESIFDRDLIFGLYAGIILVMMLYNLFLYFTVRDRSYLYYVLYILFVGMSQACLQGYAPRFLYPDSYFLTNAMMVWVPALSGVFSVLFIWDFMNIKHYTPTLYKVLFGILLVYCGIIALSFTGNYRLCTAIMQLLVMILAIVGYTVAVKISRMGYRPAKFFLIAFSIFIAGVFVFVLRNVNVLPYNTFTYYAMPIGSVLEVVLLSIALADKINLFRKEKEESQAQALLALQENERIVIEQNVMLERKVNERTQELQVANSEVHKAMKELKEAESQLVESEKMASLGQLTAGIAHEINNPINFVTSNVKPLNRDVRILLETVDAMEKMILDYAPGQHKEAKRYKEEIDYDYLKVEIDQLLSGISDGASRTAEIVKGLRIFSRLDEDDLKKADINEGMDSTLIITNNMLNNHIKVQKNYANLPLIECYPGKLNQVFLNIISNGIYAIQKRFGDQDGGILVITTYHDDKHLYIKIADNGTGMDEQTKKRLFEPFFTTKDVGEGTGLGLSIAYNTINKHNGQIQIESELGKGTEFIIKLPLQQQ